MPRYSSRLIVAIAIVAAACSPTRGCVEASFILSPESRIPHWFAVDPAKRTEFDVSMDYSFGVVGRTAEFRLLDRSGRTLKRVIGKEYGNEPLTLPPGSDSRNYPSYGVIVADGITEIIEHRRMEPVFDINDDPAVRAGLAKIVPGL